MKVSRVIKILNKANPEAEVTIQIGGITSFVHSAEVGCSQDKGQPKVFTACLSDTPYVDFGDETPEKT